MIENSILKIQSLSKRCARDSPVLFVLLSQLIQLLLIHAPVTAIRALRPLLRPLARQERKLLQRVLRLRVLQLLAERLRVGEAPISLGLHPWPIPHQLVRLIHVLQGCVTPFKELKEIEIDCINNWIWKCNWHYVNFI